MSRIETLLITCDNTAKHPKARVVNLRTFTRTDEMSPWMSSGDGEALFEDEPAFDRFQTLGEVRRHRSQQPIRTRHFLSCPDCGFAVSFRAETTRPLFDKLAELGQTVVALSVLDAMLRRK